MATRLRVAVVGQASPPELIKVSLDGDATIVRTALVEAAADALGVQRPASVDAVRLYLDGGATLRDASMLERDDNVFVAFDGGQERVRALSMVLSGLVRSGRAR